MVVTPRLFLLSGKSLKSIEIGNFDADFGARAESPPIEELAASVPYLFAAISARANGIASLPRRFMRGDQEIDERDLPFTINWPELLWRTEYSLCLYGVAYWFRVRNSVRVFRVRWLDPLTITPLADPRRGLYGFERRVTPRSERYELDENGLHKQLVYFWLPGLREVAPGLGTAQVARRAAEVLRSVDTFADLFFDQGGMPLTLLVIPPATPDAERERLENRFQRLAHGLRNAFKPVAVRSNIEVKTLGATPANLGMTELVDSKRDAILAALGVPISLVLGTAVNYATAAQEAKNFIANTLAPRARLLQAEINRQLLAEFGLELLFDYESLPAMREDERQAASAFQQYVMSGLTPGQAAQIVGVDMPEPEPAPTPTFDAADVAIAAEYRRWQTKARRAVKSGADPSEFVSDILPRSEYLAVREALRGARTEEEVEAVFAAAPFLRLCLEEYPTLC